MNETNKVKPKVPLKPPIVNNKSLENTKISVKEMTARFNS